MYYLYILRCSDTTLYTGITTDLKRRLMEHNETLKGAKYTRLRRPVKIVFFHKFDDRSSASKEEYRIKKLSKKEKEQLVASFERADLDIIEQKERTNDRDSL